MGSRWRATTSRPQRLAIPSMVCSSTAGHDTSTDPDNDIQDVYWIVDGVRDQISAIPRRPIPRRRYSGSTKNSACAATRDLPSNDAGQTWSDRQEITDEVTQPG